VHFGIFRDGILAHYEYCLEEIAVKQLAELDKYSLAGNIPVEGAEPPKINTANMATLLAHLDSAPEPAADARAYPIVEVLS
jgi:tRNA threonylcarbamoyladenosine biosynthesis protein TsaB